MIGVQNNIKKGPLNFHYVFVLSIRIDVMMVSAESEPANLGKGVIGLNSSTPITFRVRNLAKAVMGSEAALNLDTYCVPSTPFDNL